MLYDSALHSFTIDIDMTFEIGVNKPVH